MVRQKHAAGVLLILTGSNMSIAAVMPARLAHTWIDDSVRMRETTIGKQCEILAHSVLEYSELGDFAYVGEHCCPADTQVGRFCAIANQVRIGAPNHPMSVGSHADKAHDPLPIKSHRQPGDDQHQRDDFLS